MTSTATIVDIESRSLAAAPAVQILTLELSGAFEFQAGQYLEVVHPDGTAIPLSIASPPEQLPALTLHYRSTTGMVEAERMDELLCNRSLSLRGGSGNVFLNVEDDSPLLLVAGGTGISQALCLASAQCSRHPKTEVTLLACADTAADLYFRDLLPVAPGLRTHLVADATRDSSNRGIRWLSTEGAAPDTRVVISGSPAFVYAATDTLLATGIDQQQLESDVYAWAPR